MDAGHEDDNVSNNAVVQGMGKPLQANSANICVHDLEGLGVLRDLGDRVLDSLLETLGRS